MDMTRDRPAADDLSAIDAGCVAEYPTRAREEERVEIDHVALVAVHEGVVGTEIRDRVEAGISDSPSRVVHGGGQRPTCERAEIRDHARSDQDRGVAAINGRVSSDLARSIDRKGMAAAGEVRHEIGHGPVLVKKRMLGTIARGAGGG